MIRIHHLCLAGILFFANESKAWLQRSSMSVQTHERSQTKLGSASRRSFFSTSSTTAAVAFVTLGNPKPTLAALTVGAAKDQWKSALNTLDLLLHDWSSVSEKGGDAIRIQLGTQGTTSPLFQIDKVLKMLRDDAADFIEFQETSDEFQLALARADSMAYSANFAGGSGKPTPPAVYIEKSKKECEELLRIAKSLDAQLQ